MTPGDIEKLLEPTVNGLGYELYDLDIRTGGDGLLRVYIDCEAGIDITDCEKVSKQISALLDVEDPIAGEYSLEVSSPGLDRRLKRAEHFARFIGEEVKLQLLRANDGRRRYRGSIDSVAGDEVTLIVDGQAVVLAVDDIEMARLVLDPKKIGRKSQG